MEANSEIFYLKNIQSDIGSQSILLQNENGPCALIAIINVLILRDTAMAACVNAHRESGSIEESELLSKLGEVASSQDGNNEQLETLFEFLPKLSKGLDVNPKFDGTFSESPELGLFESFGIRLLHGWVIGDVECADLDISLAEREELANLSYEQLCAIQFSDNPNTKFRRFMESYPTQMTHSGFTKLNEELAEGEMAVLFWNNHFSTIINHNLKLYALVTDYGFQNKPQYVWEIVDLNGAGEFVNGFFKPADEQVKQDESLALELASKDQVKPSPSGKRQPGQRPVTSEPKAKDAKKQEPKPRDKTRTKNIESDDNSKKKKSKKKNRDRCIVC